MKAWPCPVRQGPKSQGREADSFTYEVLSVTLVANARTFGSRLSETHGCHGKAVATSRARSRGLFDFLGGCPPLGAPFQDETICEIVFVDVADVSDCFQPNLLADDILNVLKPDIEIESALGGF